MRRLSRLDAAFLTSAAVAVGLIALWTSRPWIDRFFLCVLVACLVYLLRLGAVAWTGAREERRRAAELQRLRPDDVARAAVVEERARLSADIAQSLRDTLVAVSADAAVAVAAADPVPALIRIQSHARRATSDLRRQLGLLREPDAAVPDVGPPASSGPPRLTRRDWVVGAVVTLLAVVEVTAYVLAEGYGEGSVYAMPGSIVTSALAASCITWRRVEPAAAAVACAAVFGLGIVVDAPVGGGFWSIATVGGLVWTLAATAPARPVTPLSWVTLTAMVAHSRRVDDPDNALIFGLLIAVCTTLGLAVRLYRYSEQRAAARAGRHRSVLQRSAEQAVTRERHAFAREIHDVVSHAVGLVAMQAAAAEVSWPHDPDATRRAIGVIEATTESTLGELDRLLPGGGAPSPPELGELVERIRLTGTRVDLAERGEVPAALAPLVHRIVQEGLTNVVRHAPGASVRVEVRGAVAGVSIAVVDDGPGPVDGGQPGYGLVGVAERVGFVGGAVTSGAAPGGRGFELRAHLPAVRVEATG